ncbi:unnamed protein product [Lymnaea stagnalis]|uniref:G-protein coupled receptors family 1 profile domain-containing protein n=1 Tax=Lymnaea stagnalis TaxID=6523 RepID=A0AAV2IGN1_LYMST
MLFIIPVAAMTYIFVQIRRRLWGSSIGVTTNVRKKRSVIRFLAFDILVFVLCWLPFYMVDIVSDSVKLILGNVEDDEVDENQVYVLLRFFFIILALSNSFLNPLIYAFFNKNFMNEVRLMLSKSWCGTCALNRVVPVNTDETQASGLPEEPVIITT